MRPSAPPLLFWNVSASTTCSRVTLFILVRTRPIGRPWSWSIGGMAVAPPPDGAGAGVPPPAGGLAAPPAEGGRRLAEGRRGPAEVGRGAPLAPGAGAAGFFPGSGAGVEGLEASV